MYIAWQTIKFIFVDLVWQTIYFPLWWYSQGAWAILKMMGREIKEFAHSLNLGILFKHLLSPMYGFNDFASRVISFFVRIVYFFVILLLTLAWLIALTIVFLIWLLLPLFIVYNILYQLNIVDFNFYAWI